MHDYSDVTLGGHLWGRAGHEYEKDCARCEIEIIIRAEEDRKAIIVEGRLRFYAHQKRGERVLFHDVPRFGLKKFDRLEPSPNLLDVGRLEDVVMDPAR
eukprot:3524554-Pyramimonas_sp.AAC.1